MLDVEAYNRALTKLDSPEKLTQVEIQNYTRVFNMRMSKVASTHMLWSMGLLVDGEWEIVRADWIRWWVESPFSVPSRSKTISSYLWA